MEPLGWLIFIVSNAIVIGLLVFCFYKVFSLPQEHMSSPLEIDTHDLSDENENGDNDNQKSNT